MSFDGPLKAAIGAETVENVVVFVSDSFRFDALPERFLDRGLVARAISASTFTGSGVPSLMTGLYPTNHGIWGFEDQLPATPPLFTAPENHGFDIRDIWAWPMEVLNLEVPPWEELTERRLLSDLPEPFVYVFHCKGGHVPYGHSPDDWDSIRSFFRNTSDPDTLRDLYHDSIETSLTEFERLLDTLADRGILNRTLVMLTSDHGELLGEYGGLWGHGKPMTPELLWVPIAFFGAGIETTGRYDRLLSTTDVAPTALAAMREAVPSGLDGSDVWTEAPPTDRRVESHLWQGGPENPLGAEYRASALWEAEGGVVCHQNSPWRRFPSILAQYRGEFAPVTRTLSPRRILAQIRVHLRRSLVYGSPSFTVTEARERLPSRFSANVNPPTTANIEPDEEQLRKLGYL